MATRLHGYTATRLHGYMATRLHGCTAARLHGCTATRLHGCTAARLHGYTASGSWELPEYLQKNTCMYLGRSPITLHYYQLSVEKMKSFIIFLALAAALSCVVGQIIDYPDLRYLKAYTSTDPHATPAHEFLDSCPDLGVLGLDNVIKRVCVTGYWILYSEISYDNEANYIRGVNYCYTLSTSASISSLRYAGSPYGMDDVYFNLYESSFFEGNEFKGNTNTETVVELDMKVSSLIVSGQSPWTFFTGLKFTGQSACVHPEYQATDNGISMHYNYVLSVRKICRCPRKLCAVYLKTSVAVWTVA
ncbi:uncharacterized protein LOC108676254 [Hyalella azteca]|uniref:Uncharacterized protein LOC108676254 n=1 Tax=Hyalella azteca TaxID=294128 RepID=A0A8B7P418_HYAAZ|nr:uncharacterized protein LOC108676254 [Hyalella azteca]